MGLCLCMPTLRTGKFFFSFQGVQGEKGTKGEIGSPGYEIIDKIQVGTNQNFSSYIATYKCNGNDDGQDLKQA